MAAGGPLCTQFSSDFNTSRGGRGGVTFVMLRAHLTYEGGPASQRSATRSADTEVNSLLPFANKHVCWLNIEAATPSLFQPMLKPFVTTRKAVMYKYYVCVGEQQETDTPTLAQGDKQRVLTVV